MKRSTKYILIIAFCFILLGIGLYVAAIAQTGRFNLNSQVFSSDYTLPKSFYSDEEVQSLHITEIDCHIQILPAEDNRVAVTWTDTPLCSHDVRLEDGRLEITAKNTAKGMSHLFSFDIEQCNLTIYLPAGIYGESHISSVSGDIIIPAEFQFRDLDVETVSGCVSLSCAVEENLDLDTTSGEISLEGIRPRSLELDSISGEVLLTDLAVSEFSKLNTVSGDIQLMGFDSPRLICETVSAMVSGTILSPRNIRTDTTSGTIRISDRCAYGTDWQISTVSGDIDISVAP